MAYSGRYMLILLVILLLLLVYSPQTRQALIDAWQTVRPVLVAFLDDVYTALRDLLTGNTSDQNMDQQPAHPKLRYQRMVTMVVAL